MRIPQEHTVLIALLVLAPGFAIAHTPAVPSARATEQPCTLTITPDPIQVGSPELLRIHPSANILSVEAEWSGRKLDFFPSQATHTWSALAGVDVEAQPGPSALHLLVHTSAGDCDLSRNLP